jgi:hypothetical protein
MVMPMRPALLAAVVASVGGLALSAATAQLGPPPLQPPSPAAPPSQSLKAPAEFSSVGDRAARSRAMFTEIARVLTHPRCMNCHPAGNHALQGAGRAHNPAAWRDDPDTGTVGTNCATCHTEANVTLHEAASYRSIPGHPRWGLAAKSMAWEGKSVGDICRQLKDPKLNGGRDLAMLHEHIAKDDLVAWGWRPGVGRQPAPGSQDEAGKLVQAWIDTGAECP